MFLETRVKVKPDQTKSQTLGKQADGIRNEEQGIELVGHNLMETPGALLGGASRQLREGFELLVGGEVSAVLFVLAFFAATFCKSAPCPLAHPPSNPPGRARRTLRPRTSACSISFNRSTSCIPSSQSSSGSESRTSER